MKHNQGGKYEEAYQKSNGLAAYSSVCDRQYRTELLHGGVNVKKVYAAQKQSEYVIVTKDHSAYEELTKEYEDSLTSEAKGYGEYMETVSTDAVYNTLTLKLTEEEAKELSGESDVVVVEENIDISLNSLSKSETSENNSKTGKNKTNDGKTAINKTGSSETNENKTNKSTTGDGNSSSDVNLSDKSGEKVNCDDTEHWNLKMINAENVDDLYETSYTSGESNSSDDGGVSTEDDEETIS